MKTILLTLFALSASFAQYTLHILSPWAADPVKILNRHHLNGGATGIYNADPTKQMTRESDGYFTQTFPKATYTWEDFTLKNCGLATDQNCNGGETWKTAAGTEIKPKVVDLFGTEKEIWVIPDASAKGYHIELIPPGAKVIWFKSPWGNKVLPNMIVGTDTVRLRYSTEPTRCGWFKGALRDAQITLGQVHFQRPYTDKTLPVTGSLNLTSLLAKKDTLFVDGTAATLAGDSTVGTAGTCMDTARVVHILHPWASDPNRFELPVYLHAGNILGNYAAMDSTGELKGWWRFAFSAAQYAHTEFKTANLDIRSYYPTPENATQTYASLKLTTLFPSGEYEVWLLPVGTTFKVIRAPLQIRTINIMNPFEGTVPRLLLGADTLRMTAISDTCGWYRTTLYEEPLAWTAKFKQALGTELYTSTGIQDSAAIDLDSLMALGNQAWIKPNPYPTGAAVLSSTYPGPPGECPSRELAVMVFDRSQNEDDFQQPTTGCGGHWLGMVEEKLVNGNLVQSTTPPRQANGNAGTCAPKDLANWFTAIPLSGGKTNATCYDLPLALDADGFWLADYYENKAKAMPGFFPLDNFRFLDTAKTIANPNFSQDGDCSSIGLHNFAFTMHVNAEFKYVPGQYFDFRGDDDVWVFINDSLVVDIGGVHGPISGSVNVDSLGLTAGTIYPFDIFFAERNTCGSNFKMRTSMDLKTDRTFYPLKVDAPKGVVSYEIWQILKEQSLSCDFSNTAAADTVKAASNFLLSGPMFPTGPRSLISGVNYGGITIGADFTSFSIDTVAIVRDRSLAPGQYKLTFIHSIDGSLSGEVTFNIPSYPLPGITFTDSLWKGINPNTTKLGEWAFIPYAVYIEARYMGIKCPDCTDELLLDSPDSLVFLDSNKSPITSIKLDSGRAVIWVMGQAKLDSASFRVHGASVQNELWWKNIQLKEPPVPFLRLAQMHDRNGDGMADSLILGYSRALKGKDAPDSLQWRWGDQTDNKLKKSAITKYILKDSLVVITGDSLTDFIATGNSDGTAYQGASLTWFTYIPTEGADSGKIVPFEINAPIEDHMGPIVVSAEVGPGKSVDTLIVTLSESIVDDSIAVDSLFAIHAWRSAVESSADMSYLIGFSRLEGSKFVILYSNKAAVTPAVGDSIRLLPKRGRDLSQNFAHSKNPWVRIIGRQRSRVETVGLVEMDSKTTPKENSPPTRVVLANPNQNIKDIIAQEGVPGHLIRFDLANVIESTPGKPLPKDIVLEFETWYFTNEGQFVNKSSGRVTCADSLFQGDCTKNPGNLFIGWNTRSQSGRLVGTGAYVARLHFVVKARSFKLEDKTTNQTWGIRRKR